MPRNRGVTGEQWSTCERCGRQYPISQIAMQNGVLICTSRCWDDTTVQQHDTRVSEVLMTDMDQEGVDLRYMDQQLATRSGEEW